MTLKIDKVADALYLKLSDNPVQESEETAPGIIMDYDASGKIIGIEMLTVSKRANSEELNVLHFENR